VPKVDSESNGLQRTDSGRLSNKAMEVIGETGWLTWPQIKIEYEEGKEILAIFTTIGKNS